MTEELIRRLLEFLETASPFVWEVVNRQVLVVIVQSIFWCVILIVIAIVCTILARKELIRHKEHEYDMHDFNSIACSITAASTAIIAAFLLSDITGYLINPDYCAIKIMLKLIKLD